MRNVVLIVLMVAGATVVIACGSGEGGGDTVAGRRIFMGEVVLTDATGQACSNCHAVQPGEPDGVIGNNLSNVGNCAMTRVDGMSPEEYLRTSLVDPDISRGQFLGRAYATRL